MNSDDNIRRGRETTLIAVMLTILIAAFILFLNFVSLGLFFYVIAAIFTMGTVGFLHYMLWGQSLTEEVAREREAFLRQQKRELDEMENPYAIQVKRRSVPPTHQGEDV
jgi:signal transduction histidine kinase